MKPGERYMMLRRETEAQHIMAGSPVKRRPAEWPARYKPEPGTNDYEGQRDYFGYLRDDGMWMHMPSPGTHEEVGMSEFYVSQNPGSWRRPVSIAEKIAALYAPTPVEPKRPWWRFW